VRFASFPSYRLGTCFAEAPLRARRMRLVDPRSLRSRITLACQRGPRGREAELRGRHSQAELGNEVKDESACPPEADLASFPKLPLSGAWVRGKGSACPTFGRFQAPTGRDPTAQVGAQRRPGLSHTRPVAEALKGRDNLNELNRAAVFNRGWQIISPRWGFENHQLRRSVSQACAALRPGL
jgi:hypothetical protein